MLCLEYDQGMLPLSWREISVKGYGFYFWIILLVTTIVHDKGDFSFSRIYENSFIYVRNGGK